MQPVDIRHIHCRHTVCLTPACAKSLTTVAERAEDNSQLEGKTVEFYRYVIGKPSTRMGLL